MEGLFYTTFREHMIGQPLNGNRDTVMNLTKEDIQNHKERCFQGSNFSLVVTGDVDAQKVFQTAQKSLS
jgi:predicted Zn-dependent peptidase